MAVKPDSGQSEEAPNIRSARGYAPFPKPPLIGIDLRPDTRNASQAYMTSVVPQLDDRLVPVVFITQCTKARRAQHEKPAGGRFEPQPSGGEYAQEMPA